MPLTIETQGTHPSTGLCLEAMQRLHEGRDFINILDMGCGNGILSVAAAAVWDADVLAVDISEKAMRDAESNIAAHGLGERITLLRSDGFADPAIRRRAPYDLIICNMLAEFTVESAREVKKHITDGGICILAGILAWKAEAVIAAYTGLGFEIIKELFNSPWQCYILCHKNNAIVTKP